MYQSIAGCRSCNHRALEQLLSFGEMPLADGFVAPERSAEPEHKFPLTLLFCPECSLVQIRETVSPRLLFGGEYLYYSSFSESWLRHCAENAERLISELQLDADSLVVEIACNDGYMLKNFQQRGIPTLGVDPADPVEVARKQGIPVVREFFGSELSRRLRQIHGQADVIIANNVLAHVADLPDFLVGIRGLLKDDGCAVIEVPYVGDLIERGEFDTIYHEHHCYFSVTAVDRLLRRHEMRLADVTPLSTHGGSIRLTVGKGKGASSRSVEEYLDAERERGMTSGAAYRQFVDCVERVRSELLQTLSAWRDAGRRIAAYGAAAKGTMLLNACNLTGELIEYVVDRNVHKQGMFMPGVKIPIRPPSDLVSDRPDEVLVLAWNLADEIVQQQQSYLDAGGRFLIPIPELKVVSSDGSHLVAAGEL